MDDQDVIREFLVESYENLSSLDQAFVELEKHPKDAELLASIFRTIHTIKGTCGFLAFSTLEKISHLAESLLSQLREGQRELSPALVSVVFEAVDAIRKVLASIEATGKEGEEQFEELIQHLREEAQGKAAGPKVMAPVAPETPAEPAQDPAEGASTPGARPEDGMAKSSAAEDANIRVGVGLLDKLMDLVGELVLTRNQILQFNTEREDPALNATSQRLNLITTELQEGVMKTRMQPIGVVWNKLPRMVRDMAVAVGKQIYLEMDGAGTEMDRTIIEAIKDPLIHLIRNACDHGIEAPEVRGRAGKRPLGRLTLRAYHEGGQVNIEINDDGAGIDAELVKRKAVEKGLLRPEQAEALSEREALNLIFHAGLTTAKTVTKLSGRGVGMDVVKSHIEKIGGVVNVFSRPGEGTTVRIKIPLTLAVIPGLVVSLDDHRDAPRGESSLREQQFVIPQVSLVKLVRLEGEAAQKSIERIRDTAIYRLRGNLLPIVYLNEVLGQPGARRDASVVNIAVLQAEDREFGLVVGSIKDTQEIVVKPLDKQLKGLSVYAGATIMGDGRVALILDVLGIGQRSGVLSESREHGRAGTERTAQAAGEQERLLLFRAGSFQRLAIPLALVARLEEFPLSAIERAGGGLVVQYRSRILPLVALRDLLDSTGKTEQTADPVPVIVFNDGDRSIGVIVDEILDVAEEAVTVRQKAGRKGLLGSAVVGKRVTDFLDLNVVIEAAAENWSPGSGLVEAGRRILVAEASAFSRGLIRSGLDMAGYQVTEAANLEEAIRCLEQQPVHAVVAALSFASPGPSPGASPGASALVSAMRGRAEWARIPLLALADSAEQMRDLAIQTAGFADCQKKFDSTAMLESLQRLAHVLAASAAEPVGVEGGTR
jgi:two-component system chemotaxis sensor kinase CheA